MRNFIQMLAELASVMFVIILICLFMIFTPAYFLDVHQCGKYSEITQKDTKYEAFMCFVKSGNTYIPYSEYKLRSITNERK